MPQRIDDESIQDNDLLWRRIVNIADWVKRASNGSYRVSSAAFIDGIDGEVSVCLAALTFQEGVLLNRPDDGLVEIEAGIPRSLGHAIVRDPTPEDPSHALICPSPNKNPSTRKRDARAMAVAAKWLVKPRNIR